jgi:hypothetical protein
LEIVEKSQAKLEINLLCIHARIDSIRLSVAPRE